VNIKYDMNYINNIDTPYTSFVEWWRGGVS